MSFIKVKLKNGNIGIVDYIYERIFYEIIAVAHKENECTILFSPTEKYDLSISMKEAIDLLENRNPEILSMLNEVGCNIRGRFENIIIEYNNKKYKSTKRSLWSRIFH